MTWESWYWRTDLTKFALSLRKRANQKRWPDAANARCEQTIMVGFFYVRKLIESRKLSRDFADQQFKVTSYAAKGRHIHFLNYHRDLDELFDMNAPKQLSMRIEDLAHQMIHSYIFYLCTEAAGGLRSVLVASDRIRNSKLLEISAKHIVEIFEIAAKGEDDDAISMTYVEKKGDYVVRIAKSR
jgi:hypothetical protein